jgi:tetratricopeptide (TPR) repeat protein
MNKPLLSVLFAFALLAPPLAAQEALEERQKLMEEHYARALQMFNDGDFSKAIAHWQEILRIDPEQSAPPALIKQARAKLSEQLTPLEKGVKEAVAAGRYTDALEKAGELVEKDASNAAYKTVRTKLEAVTAVKPSETAGGKAGQLVRKGLQAHLSVEEDPRLAVLSLRYARDVSPQDASIQKLVAYVEGEYPDVAKREAVAPGMSVVDAKLFIALNHIYEGRYDLAVFACNEVLELEPGNLLALKRKGSAYFALNQKDKAREIWRLALKVDPNDAEIQKFLTAK